MITTRRRENAATSGRLILGAGAALSMLLAVGAASAQSVRTERLVPEGLASLQLIEGSITGYELVDYVIGAEQSQILSVDLQSSNAASYFNILPAGSEEAIFIGSAAGNVADVPAPAAGEYVIRVYLMRSAARRNETADYVLGVSLGRPEFADALSGGPDFWEVSGVGEGEALNIRGGPSTRYPVIAPVNHGRVLQNQGCRLTGEQRWCQIRVTGSGVTGWVAGRFLVETAPPRQPAVSEDGPVGNGVPFDATGTVDCATAADQPMRQCPFGVVRQGVGNAGVWISLGGGIERQILFEGGVPVATSPADALSFEKSDGSYDIRVGGERYEIPEAIVYGG